MCTHFVPISGLSIERPYLILPWKWISFRICGFPSESTDFAWNPQISIKIGKNPHFSLNLQEVNIRETFSFENPRFFCWNLQILQSFSFGNLRISMWNERLFAFKGNPYILPIVWLVDFTLGLATFPLYNSGLTNELSKTFYPKLFSKPSEWF